MSELYHLVEGAPESRLRIINDVTTRSYTVRMGNLPGRRARLHRVFPKLIHDESKPVAYCMVSALKRTFEGGPFVCLGLNGVNVTHKFMDGHDYGHVQEIMERVKQQFDVTISEERHPDFHFDDYERAVTVKTLMMGSWCKFTFVNDTGRDVCVPGYLDDFGDTGFICDAGKGTKVTVYGSCVANVVSDPKLVTAEDLFQFPSRYGTSSISFLIPKDQSATLVTRTTTRT